jgi:hypothetical protein
MVLLICGHPRSGTTLLQRLCDAHPEMAVTNELGNLDFLGQSFWQYSKNILRRRREVNGGWAFHFSYAKKHERDYLHEQNLRFALRHLRYLPQKWKPVTTETIEASYQTMFPRAKVIGDKLPHYIFRLENFAARQDMDRLVIYRDCRDVVSSFLKMVRTTWQGMSWTKYVDNAEKVATRWVRTINHIEEYADSMTVMRYETLMHEPVNELQRVAAAIGVDPAGFPADMIRPTSIGNYKKGLTAAEIDTILEIAGPTMERYGYL